MNHTISKVGAVIVTISVMLFAICMLIPFDFGSYYVCIFLAIGYVIMAAGFWKESDNDHKVSATAGIIFAAIYAVIIMLVYFAQTTTVTNESLDAQILFAFIRRNVKLFFKDKGMFFSSLITPLILLVLYATFLSNVYKDSFASALPAGLTIPEKLLNGTVATQMISALLAVCCVTISFCANLRMIGDKADGTVRDFTVSPIKKSVMALGYYVSSAVTTLVVTFTALALCFIYLAFQGWYLTFTDVLLVIENVLLLTLFGTALSSCINFFLSTNGQASAVGTIVSAGYGFLCGAYMPISSFPDSLQNVLKFLPGTYGTSLLRNHIMRGVFAEMESFGFPKEVMTAIRDGIDCNLYFGKTSVSVPAMAIIMVASIILFTGLFVLFNMFIKNKER